MKKHLFLLALGAAALTGCTSSEVLDEGIQSNAIGFSNVVNKPSRAVSGDLTNTSFDNFLVYGYYIKPGMTTPIQIFNGVPVQKKKDDGVEKWVYSEGGTRYWVPGCTYYFYAYSCADVALTSGKGNPSFSLFDGTNPTVDDRALTLQQYLCDSEHQHDLVTAENENIVALESGNHEVSLPFRHALCKVKAVFTTDFPVGYKVYVSNVSVSSFYNKADYNVGTNTWSNYTANTNNPAYVSLSFGSATNFVENKPGSELSTSEAFLIPKNYDTKNSENVKLHFTITVAKVDNINGQVVENNVLQRNIVGTWSPQWTGGNIYKYNVVISGSSAGIEPIVFAANQEIGASSWDDTTTLDMVFGIDPNPVNE
ncbi:MAG: fimbrillin family protein [Muribaculaceae bacterium]|nr:fimbrillin family protein [Muribaculaceae bacterium]